MRGGLHIGFRQSAVFILGGALVLGACGDDFPAGSGGGAPGGAGGSIGGSNSGGSAGGSGGAPSGTFSAMVYEVGPYDWTYANPMPMQGATVTADLPGGERVEATTGADGQVTFEGIDWALGTATITAYRDGYRLITGMGLSENDDGVAYYLVDTEAPAWVEVAGTATNKHPDSVSLLISPTVPGVSDSPMSFDFTVGVAPDVPFSLVALEWKGGPDPTKDREYAQTFYGWGHVSHAAITNPASVDVDFVADALTPIDVTGTFRIPDDPVLRSTSKASYWVTTLGSNALATMGAHTRTYLAMDEEEFTFEGQHVVVPGVDDVATIYRLSVDAGGPRGYSTLIQDAYPTDGATIDGFLKPAHLTRPENPAASTPMTDPIEWWTLEQDVEFVVLTIAKDGVPLWQIGIDIDSVNLGEPHTFTLPELPAGADPEVILGTGVFDAELRLSTDCSDVRCDRYVKTAFRLRR